MKYRIVKVQDDEDVKYYIEFRWFFMWQREWVFNNIGCGGKDYKYHVYTTLYEAKIKLDEIISKKRNKPYVQKSNIIETVVCESKYI